VDQGISRKCKAKCCRYFTLWLALHAIAFAERTTGGFVFGDFSSTSGLNMVGSAQRSGRVLRITPAKNYRHGGVWHSEKQPVGGGFETVFQFQFTKSGGLGGGADGLAFVLQNSGPKALGAKGGSGGFATGEGNHPGIPSSIAVFLDTFQNEEAGDPSGNYLTICTSGRSTEMQWPPSRLAIQRKLPIKLKDGKPHFARIVYKPPVLSVYLDNQRTPVLTSTVDLSTVVDPEGHSWVGLTASTGGGYENHDVVNWSFSGQPFDTTSTMVTSEIQFHRSECMPGKNLCTFEKASIEETSQDLFHVILPAHLQWGASIPNPSGRRVTLQDARGMACWEARRGSEGCSGPTPVTLIQRNANGRTYFSVHDPSGSFSDNEGFFDFQVRLQ
jgi:hypothetical protein